VDKTEVAIRINDNNFISNEQKNVDFFNIFFILQK